MSILRCPKCSGKCNVNGNKERTIKDYRDGIVKDISVIISRYRCVDCGHSFSMPELHKSSVSDRLREHIAHLCLSMDYKRISEYSGISDRHVQNIFRLWLDGISDGISITGRTYLSVIHLSFLGDDIYIIGDVLEKRMLDVVKDPEEWFQKANLSDVKRIHTNLSQRILLILGRLYPEIMVTTSMNEFMDAIKDAFIRHFEHLAQKEGIRLDRSNLISMKMLIDETGDLSLGIRNHWPISFQKAYDAYYDIIHGIDVAYNASLTVSSILAWKTRIDNLAVVASWVSYEKDMVKTVLPSAGSLQHLRARLFSVYEDFSLK